MSGESMSSGDACALPRKRTPNSIHVPLFKNEDGGMEFPSWPQIVQSVHMRELARWADRYPDLTIIELTHSIDPVRRVTITEFHDAPAAAQATTGDWHGPKAI